MAGSSQDPEASRPSWNIAVPGVAASAVGSSAVGPSEMPSRRSEIQVGLGKRREAGHLHLKVGYAVTVDVTLQQAR